MGRTFENLGFDDAFARLGQAFAVPTPPIPVVRPRLVAFDPGTAELLDLDPGIADHPDTAAYLSGNRLPAGAVPVAQAYAGHQYGAYVPRLGDGRSLLLGEIVNGRGERLELRLKGCGPTPFARGFDGRCTLRSALREFLASQALHGLEIPTIRPLSLVETGEVVERERSEPAAVLAQVAPTLVRFGTFEYFHHAGEPGRVAQLADHVIERHFPEISAGAERYARFLGEVVDRTADLVAMWQAAGFCHGMMNTDNMSVVGLTLDYGPFTFMEAFRPALDSNPEDVLGRYAFDRQPVAAFWNLTRFAAALGPLVPEEEASERLFRFEARFRESYRILMAAKLGLEKIELVRVDGLLEPLFRILEADEVDYATFFRSLGDLGRDLGVGDPRLLGLVKDRDALARWLAAYRVALQGESASDEARARRMRGYNPSAVLRPGALAHAVQQAVEEGNFAPAEALGTSLLEPYRDPPPGVPTPASVPEANRTRGILSPPRAP